VTGGGKTSITECSLLHGNIEIVRINSLYVRMTSTSWTTDINKVDRRMATEALVHQRHLLVENILANHSCTLYTSDTETTGWLKLKYPTGQNAISRQLCETFIPKFVDLCDRSCYNSVYFKNYFSFLQSYGYVNILCHIFNSARNNQHQLVIFIVKKHWLLLKIPKSDK